MRPALCLLLALLAASPAACAYRPARFTDAPAVTVVADDAPIPVPGRRDPVKEIYYVEAYMHRPAALALDPDRAPTAGDVNALDEVPRSSWFDPSRAEGEDDEGPPIPPYFVVLSEPESSQGGLAISDVRRVRYELARDPPLRSEVRTAGAAISARLYNAVGWRAPEVHVVIILRHELQSSSREGAAAADAFMREPAAPTGPMGSDGPPGAVRSTLRVRAMRWPVGIDVGPTPVSGTRAGDPNDRVAHTERRTLRALQLALFWAGASRLDPNALHDTYDGPPGAGHLLHWIVGLDDALGANAVEDVQDARLGGQGRQLGANALMALATLGLGLRHPAALQTTWPSLGDYPARAALATFAPQPPFEPFDRLLPADAYWAAKRIAAVPDGVLERAVASARMTDAPSVERALFVLQARRETILATAFAAVTPIEVLAVDAARLTLRDEAIARGVHPVQGSTYTIEYLDASGDPLAQAVTLAASGATLVVPLPPAGPAYQIVRARVVRGGQPAPRACELHLARDGAGARVIGLRH